MNSKEALLKLCHIATQQCKLHNVDVDFERDLVLRYMVGRWGFAIKNKDNNIHSIYTSDGTHLSLSINVPWHREAYDKAIWKPHVFNSEVQIDDKAYDVMLKAMLHGCIVTLDAQNKDEIERKFQQIDEDFKTNAKMILASKSTNPNFMSEAQALSQCHAKLSNELHSKAHPTIVLVPTGFKNIEELKIWVDLHDDA